MTVVRTRRARSSPSSIGVTLDLADAVLRLGLRLVDDLADQRLASLRGGQAGDPLELVELALPAARAALLPLGLELRSGARQAPPRAAREPLDLTIERLLPVQKAALGTLDRGALLARLFLGGATELERFVLSLEDDLLLLRPRLGDEALGVVLGVLDRVRRA